MNDHIKKAVIAVVDFGFCQIEGLMMPDGRYGMALTQANRLLVFSDSQHNAIRSLKSLLGKDIETLRVKTELNNNSAYVLTISQFRQLIRELDKRGNSVASAFIDAALEETIERRFDIAFSNKVEEAERNERLALRMARLMARQQWTNTLRDRYLELYGTKPLPEHYKKWTVLTNLVLFDKKHFCCNRDNMNQDEQRTIELFESMCVRIAKKYPHENRF
jgi:hypothetical protein